VQRHFLLGILDMSWFKDVLKTVLTQKRESYHEALFFESLIEEKKNTQNTESTDTEETEERFSTDMSYAHHLHMAGGRHHEESFSYNKHLAEYALKIGDLDVAERCYKRCIDDAKYLGRVQDEMNCLWLMTMKVYVIWGRYEESLSNFQSLLKHSDEINDRRMQADALNNMALIHYSRGEYDRALELYNQSLEIARKIGDQ
jgi:tetratricopeptide (TPR) repeat protein